MKLSLSIGQWHLEVDTDSSPMGWHVDASLNTPWWDAGTEFGLNRSKSLKVCVACGKIAKACVCEDGGVLMTAEDVTESLHEHAHDMFHHMTGTVHGEEDDDE